MTTAPRATAGRISAAACSARAAAKSRASVRAAIPWLPAPSRTSRIASPIGVPPGSRVTTTSMPAGPQGVGQQAALGGLARPITALEDHERPGHGCERYRARCDTHSGRAQPDSGIDQDLPDRTHPAMAPLPGERPPHGRGCPHGAGTGVSGEPRALRASRSPPRGSRSREPPSSASAWPSRRSSRCCRCSSSPGSWDPEQFGAFGAMAVVLLIGSTVLAATQVTIARHVASGRSLQQIGASSVLAAGLATFALAAAVAPLLSRRPEPQRRRRAACSWRSRSSRSPSPVRSWACSRATRSTPGSACSTSCRPSRESSGRSSVQRSARPPTPRCSGWPLGATLGAVVGHFVLVERLAWRSEEGTREYLVETGHAAHALIALYALTNLDVLLARAQLSAFDAGLYAAGALVARAVFFLPQAILVAAFPRIVAGARNAQRQAVAAVAVLGLLATAFVALFPTLVVAHHGRRAVPRRRRRMRGSSHSPAPASAWSRSCSTPGWPTTIGAPRSCCGQRWRPWLVSA